MEGIRIKIYEVKIQSIGSINMYPSIKLDAINKSVNLFSKRLTSSSKKTIHIFLELIHFGMSSTLIYFDGEYLEYHGGNNKEIWIAIKGYELYLLYYLAPYYLFLKSQNLFRPKIYHRIYRDDSLVVFKGKKCSRS